MERKKKIDIIETSAKERINIDEAFQKIVDLILGNKDEKKILEEFGVKTNNEINLDKNGTKKDGCCLK